MGSGITATKQNSNKESDDIFDAVGSYLTFVKNNTTALKCNEVRHKDNRDAWIKQWEGGALG